MPWEISFGKKMSTPQNYMTLSCLLTSGPMLEMTFSAMKVLYIKEKMRYKLLFILCQFFMPLFMGNKAMARSVSFHSNIAMLTFQLSDSVWLAFRLVLFSLDISQWGPACISFLHALVLSTVLFRL